MIRYATSTSLLLPAFHRKLKSISGLQHVPKTGPAILASNHIDYLDGFFIAAAVGARASKPVAILSKTGSYWWTGATIAIDRENRAASLATAERLLRKRWMVLNFVEGVRNTGTSIAFGRTGTARLALATGAPVVPIGISGFSGSTILSSLTKFLTMPPTVTIRIGRPIQPPTASPENHDMVSAFTQEILVAVAALAGKNAPA